MGDDARNKILARRARFVAAAMAGIAVGACGKERQEQPRPCLDLAAPTSAAPPPRACLKVALPNDEPRDAGTD